MFVLYKNQHDDRFAVKFSKIIFNNAHNSIDVDDNKEILVIPREYYAGITSSETKVEDWILRARI